MWSYLRNQRLKQTTLVYLLFLWNYGLFSKNWCIKFLKKTREYKSMYKCTKRLVAWTSREFQNQTILFEKKD